MTFRQKAILGAAVLVVSGALIASCSLGTEEGPGPGDNSQPRYLAMSGDFTGAKDGGVDDRFRVIFDDGSSEAGDTFSPTYNSRPLRYGEGFVYGTRDHVRVINAGGREVESHPVKGSGLVNERATSPSASAVSLAFSGDGADGPAERVATLHDGELHVAETEGYFTKGLTTCDDGSAIWLEEVGRSEQWKVATISSEGQVERFDDPEGAFEGSINDARFDCGEDGAIVTVSGEDGETVRRAVENVRTAPKVSDEEDLSDPVDGHYHAEDDAMPQSSGVTTDGAFQMDREGNYRKMPLEMGRPVKTGQFDIGGGTAHHVTYDGDRVVISYTRDADSGDLEIATFSATDPEEKIGHLVIAESSRDSNSDTATEVNGKSSAIRTLFPL
ncbi:hypothetical protein [Corynebacterium glyciniphilum]|uniref:hypothetical protein n=1 Tax=Corynebacterium glyciniphilum TaxID=1404244 RepID=UPI00264DCA0B|nr:hypothetical protein [Corynebacterium glyciniphilum]MDN5682459.1 hypothetical protein [Corynebacterium glyciniphilum]MDN6706852.1 hypothetical protein [Corynebacterium glyciniphilum]